jgi:endonuclease/exonuclease/phosphatase family metal-dependent hydrolase
MTYNIQRGGRDRQIEIAESIRACAPDVVLLQEATDPDVVHAIADRTAMKASGSFPRQSLGYLSREPLRDVSWHRPRVSQHAFIELIPSGFDVRIFGVHLSAVHAAWTEQRRVFELRALLKSVGRHGEGFHVLAGDFNTIAPGDAFERDRLPWRLRSLVWLSGGRIRWRTIQTVLEAGYTDAFRARHQEDDPGFTLPASNPQIRLDYVFVPTPFAHRIARCDVVRSAEAAIASDHLPVIADFN